MAISRTVTKYGRRRYYRGYRRYRNVSNSYFRTRVEGVYTITFPTTQQAGQPIFAENNSLNTVTFNRLFSSSQYYGSLTSMFGYYKVSGVLMEVAPGANNYKGLTTVGLNVLLGFRFGQDGAMTYQQLVADNNSIILGLNTNKRKYASTMGSNGWTSTASLNSLGSFSVASSIASTLSNAPSWTCRLSVYMIFKKSNSTFSPTKVIPLKLFGPGVTSIKTPETL